MGSGLIEKALMISVVAIIGLVVVSVFDNVIPTTLIDLEGVFETLEIVKIAKN